MHSVPASAVHAGLAYQAGSGACHAGKTGQPACKGHDAERGRQARNSRLCGLRAAARRNPDDAAVKKWVKWEEGGIKVEEEENCYLINDTKVYTPITEEDFEKSMNFGEIATDIYSDGETEDMSVYITFEPDYFVGHCIECYIEENGNFLVNGLAG